MQSTFLKQLTLFNTLEAHEIQAISDQLERHSYQKNEVLFFEGDKAEKLYIVFDGSVKLFKTSLDGKEYLLQIMRRYGIIGEVPMFEGSTYPANCVALTDAILLSISRKKLLQLIQSNPKISLGMLAVQAKKLRDFTQKIEQLALNKAEQRLANFLHKSSKIDQTGNLIADLQGMNMQELANYLGVTRENISRIIGKWIKHAIIKKQHHNFIILDIEKLKNSND